MNLMIDNAKLIAALAFAIALAAIYFARNQEELTVYIRTSQKWDALTGLTGEIHVKVRQDDSECPLDLRELASKIGAKYNYAETQLDRAAGVLSLDSTCRITRSTFHNQQALALIWIAICPRREREETACESKIFEFSARPSKRFGPALIDLITNQMDNRNADAKFEM